MKFRNLAEKIVRIGFILSLALLLACSCEMKNQISQEEYDRIAEAFVTPADTNKPWCYYYWIGDDISIEGITRDMEAMKEFGMGAVLIGNINPDEVDGPVPLFSETWWEAMTHAVVEGHRLGIDVGHFNCPGWSQSGGPWITYDKAMRHLVWSETEVVGGGHRRFTLPKPTDKFQDVAVLGFRKIAAEDRLFERNEIEFPMGSKETETVIISGTEKLSARSIVLTPAKGNFKCDVELQAQENGKWVRVKEFAYDRSNDNTGVGPVTHGPVVQSIPETEASAFRLICTNMVSPAPKAGFARVMITEAQYLENYVEKTMGKMHPTPFPEFDTYIWKSQEVISIPENLISEVVDYSAGMDENGEFSGEVPEGEWTVLRIGMTPTGTQNSPAAPQGKGYEVDKASAEYVKFHFDQYMLKLIGRIPEESRPALKYVIQDSYEKGSQNWTDGFAKKFEAKYGYDPLKYLPVFSGRVVGSVEESDRFLWDLRRSVADDVAYEFVGGFRKVAREYGLQTWLENYGHWGYPGEFLMYGGQSDLVGGEFWNEGSLGNIECKSGSSAAHMYGKPVTSAEAFTAASKSYTRHPAILKKRGDWAWTEGINHYVLHLYIHQPREEAPGINAWFSTEFNRLNTWFDQGREWVEYVRRCQHMLQQGTYVADVAYFIGEDTPKMTGTRDPELPAGYSYDYMNAEVIMERLQVEDGYFVLPDGMKYSLLVIPENANMRPEVLARLEELVDAGGVILGSAPNKSPSLQNYPECDAQVKEIASRIWHESNAGKVFESTGIMDVLAKTGVTPDMSYPEATNILWTHRSREGMEIYFITNQSDKELEFTPSFRVSGLAPQWWDAVSGEIRELMEFSDDGERTTVPMKLEKDESWFLVFTSKSNRHTRPAYSRNNPEPVSFAMLDASWKVNFQNKTFAPAEIRNYSKLESWTASENDLVKYYSGTATYTTEFTLEELPDGDLFINLGKVGVMAGVMLNGIDLGVTWMAPFRLRADFALKTGTNTLEIDVTNVWRNRMVGDLELPKAERFTTYTVSDIRKGEELQPSGLLGPVTLEVFR